jgi:twitching motility two-component system response regulator PilH
MESGDGVLLEGCRILVVDDDPDTLTFIGTILEDNGAVVRKADNGDDALAMAREEKPDLMTLDLAMPGKNGIDIFVEMRGDPGLHDLPICIITGRPEMRKLIYERPAQSQPEGYLNKPVTEKALLRTVRKIIELARQKS